MRTWVVVAVLLSTSVAFARRERVVEGTGGSVARNAGFRAVTSDVIGGSVDATQLDAALSVPDVATPLTQCFGTEKMLGWIEFRNGNVKTATVGGAMVMSLESCITKALKKAKLPTKERVVATLRIDPIPLPPPPVRRVASVGIEAQGRGGTRASDDELRVVKSRTGVYKACYQKQLSSQPGIRGGLTVRLKVGKDGDVSDAAVTASALGSDALGACLTANLARLRFPTGHEDDLTIVFEFAEN